ncbi:hypothetical protein [Colwellia psychrerythraea]|uniref:Uncharacterized protein n=1 Tax=Colwellia psychrerythraea TaxID=28229 RepID=A0A099K930_COLPS|nr:hypothetical protein [Colwellia psychrerythraea]KGJ86795.1 hypothetical protein GAB14E_4622 [Colwellia psychrerythraea]
MKLVNVVVILGCVSLGAYDMLFSKNLTLNRIPLNDEERYERMKK